MGYDQPSSLCLGRSLTMASETGDPRRIQTYESEKELRRLNDEWVAALVSRDVKALDRIMANDFSFTFPLDGDTKEQLIRDVESGQLSIQHMVRENVEARVFGSTGVVTAIDTAKWQYQGREIMGYYRIIHVYAQREGQWQLVAVQACPVAGR
jgi:ketosteroid isomerase-like protein